MHERYVVEKMERKMRIELATFSLGIFVSIEYKGEWRSRRCIQIQGNQQLPKFRRQNAS
jgi:hypothetical protein